MNKGRKMNLQLFAKQYFDAKTFNGEVFKKYTDTLPRVVMNELIRSGAIFSDRSAVSAFNEQAGAHYLTVPLFGRIGGEAQNYDGGTDIVANETGTASHSKIVVGRANAWEEKDFAEDITGGTPFMDNVGRQIVEYWEDVDQAILLSVLNGIFSMTGAKNKPFIDNHTLDLGDKAYGATTVNIAAQKALGDNKNKMAMLVMHSAVATLYENLQLLDYAKYTDSMGIERKMPIAYLNGHLVLVDDGMPFDAEGNYTTYILGRNTLEVTDVGVKVPYEMERLPAKAGGKTILYSRQRKIYSPYGISFTNKNVATLSPTNAELEDGANWELVQGSNGDVINHKAIAIGRIVGKLEDVTTPIGE